MLTIRAMSNGQGYAARHLAQNDYYAEGQRITGYWQGRGAELLGLAGEVRSEQFEAIRQGLDPASGEFLRQRQSADRIAADGTTQSRGRNLYDFTFSAPKSVSILAELAGDERLIIAHRKAVGEALQELETHAATRVRQNLANEDRITGNLVLAVYHHDTSRELDPLLHTHAVAGNLTYDGAEGRWKALQASDIYQHRAYLTEVYRNALVREVHGLGYEVENRRDAKGQDLGFEIQGVSQGLMATYSQRSQQRDEAIEEFALRQGRQPTDNEIAILVRESRPDKLLEISTHEVKRRQRERLTTEEARCLAQLRENALGASLAQRQTLEHPSTALQYAQQHVFERVSVAREQELLTEALRHSRGRFELAEVKGTLALEEAAGRIFRSGHELATQESLERERQMIAAINRGIGYFERLGGENQFVASDRLRPEQKHAVEFVLASHDLAVNLRGAAGTGKTATLEELQRGLQEAGRQTLALAPTRSAVEELHKVGFAGAATIERFLQDERMQNQACRKVLIIDEAGMVSGRQMAELLRIAERQSARLVFSGDTRQIQSVEAADALRILEKESHLKSTSLTQVQRQTAADYREAIQELRRNPEQGFEKLQAMGAVREVAWQERAQTVAGLWREAQGVSNGQGAPRQVLVVSATHEEIANVTHAIRELRRQAGEIGESVRLERHVPLNYTTAQKSEPRNFQEGQLLVFHRSTKEVNKDETLEVVRVEKDKLIARKENGTECELTRKQAKAFEVYERRAIEVAPQDKLLLTANRREPEFRATNGERVTVSTIDGDGRIRLEDGRALPPSYKQFDHGYAVTAHRSQGQSVDAVVISADVMKKELFYVAASRGRESVTIVTSDQELLAESIGRSGARQSASELARRVGLDPEQRPGLHIGEYRGLDAARKLALYHAQHEVSEWQRVGMTASLEQELPKPEHKQEIAREQSYGLSI